METRRYVGIDLGKRTYEVAIIGKKGKVTLSNGTTILRLMLIHIVCDDETALPVKRGG
ncbi:hypothetical protein FACS1894200_07590 [Spirochaetia bacterium]|nr:hypothetical protein FACS1894200_07590 [Spirochaetia bacterium]